ncbi:hypothetical protein ACE6H2_013126 [Prunus campanulata]
MFSSETGIWTESVISCPRSFRFRTLCRDAGVAYNGMLYWWSSGEGFIIGLNPYEKSGKYCFRYIENKPTDERTSGPFKFLGVSSRGHLRMCQFTLADFDDNDGDVKVWELKDDHQMDMDVYRDVDMDVVAGNNGKWCLAGRVILRDTYRDNPLIKSWTRQRDGITRWRCLLSTQIMRTSCI